MDFSLIIKNVDLSLIIKTRTRNDRKQAKYCRNQRNANKYLLISTFSENKLSPIESFSTSKSTMYPKIFNILGYIRAWKSST